MKDSHHIAGYVVSHHIGDRTNPAIYQIIIVTITMVLIPSAERLREVLFQTNKLSEASEISLLCILL